MIGQRFGRWLVVVRGEDYVYPHNNKKAIRYICDCDCGNAGLVHSAHLKNGSSKSCGCLNREISTTHGMSKTRAYKSWSNMIIRCTGSSNKADASYLEKGISFQDSWADFEEFYKDMGDCPDGFELERNDALGDYCKSNCSWADETTQATNRTKFKNNTSGYTGVTWSAVHGKWRTGLYVNKVRHEGGLFTNFEDAVEARKQLELKYLGRIKENM